MADDRIYDFGLRLKELRRRKGLTQKQLGDKLGVTKDAISHYENNTQTPSIDRLTKMAVCLNTSVDYLLGLENDPVVKISGLSVEKRKFVMEFIKYLIDGEE